MSQAELAQRMGRPLQMISEIVQGKKAITAETALQLERATGVPATSGTLPSATTRPLPLASPRNVTWPQIRPGWAASP